MLTNYIKIAWRHLFKNPTSSFINIGGLTVGMAVAILIGLWIYDEISFNEYHKNHDRIVKVMDHQSWTGKKNTNDVLPIPVGTTVRNEYSSDFKHVALIRQTEEHVIASGEKKFTEKGKCPGYKGGHS